MQAVPKDQFKLEPLEARILLSNVAVLGPNSLGPRPVDAPTSASISVCEIRCAFQNPLRSEIAYEPETHTDIFAGLANRAAPFGAPGTAPGTEKHLAETHEKRSRETITVKSASVPSEITGQESLPVPDDAASS